MRKITIISIVVAILVLISVFGVVLSYRQKIEEKATRTERPTVTNKESTLFPATNWKIYINEEYNYTIKYPANWVVMENKSDKDTERIKPFSYIKMRPLQYSEFLPESNLRVRECFYRTAVWDNLSEKSIEDWVRRPEITLSQVPSGESILLNGRKAVRYIIETDNYRTITIWLTGGAAVYYEISYIDFGPRPREQKSCKEIFDKAVGSFTLTSKQIKDEDILRELKKLDSNDPIRKRYEDVFPELREK